MISIYFFDSTAKSKFNKRFANERDICRCIVRNIDAQEKYCLEYNIVLH